MTDGIRVRLASRSDADAIAPLLGQLGYPVTAAEVGERFDRVAGGSVDPAWVAVDRDDDAGTVVGFASGHIFSVYELERPVGELTALVVDERHRRSGAGRALVAAFERWVIEAGCVRWSVATAFHRVDAHAFYERLGYTQLARKYQKSPDGVESTPRT